MQRSVTTLLRAVFFYPKRLMWMCLAWGFLSLSMLHAADSSRWTHYRMSDGLPSAGPAGVTISPRDRVWIRHLEANTITELTGYDIASQTVPEGSAKRVYESRSAQLWTTHARGIHLWSNKWKTYPIQAIAIAYQGVVQQLHSPVSLIPLQINQCLILANDGIHLFNANKPRTKKIFDLQSNGLRNCVEMIELSQGDVLISAQGGFIRYKGPAKDIEQATPRIIQLPETIRHYKLGNPLENPGEVMTFIGEAPDAPRLAIKFDSGTWSWATVPQDTVLRTYWENDAGHGWGTTYTGIYQINTSSDQITPSNALEAGQFFDVVTDGKGSAWIATSEGLVRQSPAYWKTILPELEESSVFDMAGDAKSGLWMITENELVHYNEKGQRTGIPWPQHLENIFTPGKGLFLLNNGTIGLNIGQTPLIYDPANGHFTPIQSRDPNLSIQRILAKLDNNSLLVWASGPATENALFWNYSAGNLTPSEIPSPNDQTETEFLWATELISADEIWFGSHQGVAYAKRNQWIQFAPEEGLGFDTPGRLLELRDGRLWLGAGSHVYELRSNRWESVYVTYEKINDMLEARDGTVWVATNNGVHRYVQGTWLSHSTQEGLPSNTIYKLHENAAGIIRAATTRGVCQYNPHFDRDAPITDIRMDELDQNRVLRNGSILHFQGLDRWDHTTAARLLFSYRKDSEPWKPFSHTNWVVLSNLPAGPHQVEVKAIDRNGNIESAPPVFRFDFIIPWHEDPRLMGMTIGAVVVTVLLAGFAVNRHLQLKRSYAEVERIVAIRTQELERANHELLQDQKMKALGTLASGIAHDFNSILSIIKGSVQIIESNSTDAEKVRKRVDRIHSVIDQGAGIVRSMLGYVRRKNEPSQPHDLNILAREAIQLTEENTSSHRIEFLDNPGIGKVTIVPDLVRQIMINLINNAMDSMESDGCILIRLEASGELTGHVALKPKYASPYAVLRIQDTGVGISNEIITRIFEPFYTTKAFSSRRGTGLGLSMVYEMAREMGAGLSVTSTPGKGSMFSIYISLTDQASSVSESSRTEAEDFRTK